MRKAIVRINNTAVGTFEELDNSRYRFRYEAEYLGPPISLTMPLTNQSYEFDQFPSFFEGLLPEGMMLESLLRKYKIDRYDYFGQLVQVGKDTVGAVTVETSS